jgi:hypothetical protein
MRSVAIRTQISPTLTTYMKLSYRNIYFGGRNIYFMEIPEPPDYGISLCLSSVTVNHIHIDSIINKLT